MLSKLASSKVLFFFICFYINIAVAQDDQGRANLKYINPLIGNVGQLLTPTRPTVQLPNQMMRMYPLRADHLDDHISGFPIIVLSHRLGEAFSVKPSIKAVSKSSYAQRLYYDHDLEITRPWYYSTYLLDDETKIEFTPGKKTGIYRFTFPANAAKTLLFEQLNEGEGDWAFISANEMTGTEIYHGDIKVYMYGVFSEKGIAGTYSNGKVMQETSLQEKDGKAWITFEKNISPVIEFKYAVSFVSAAQAKKNLANELASVSFEKLKAAGETAWDKVIGRVQIEGGTEAQKRTFFTSLYRCYERMVDIAEDGQYYSGFDKKVHATNRPFYVDDWTWDTYLAHHPLRTILDPVMEEDILNSYVEMYKQSGWMPTFPVLFGDHACMNGFHSSIMFLDGYRKGLRRFDVTKAYEGMLKNATQATMLPWVNGAKGSLDDFYYAHGYFPALAKNTRETDEMVHSFEKRQAVAVTLGGSYDDWAVAQLAKDLGNTVDFDHFMKRSANYKKLWNDVEGFFLPKDNKGNWVIIDPKFDGGIGGRDYYDENNGWTYLWQVQHNIPDLVELMKGRAGFENKLDELFSEGLGRPKYQFYAKFPDATGNIGQFSMGNEPSFHIPYLYNYTDSPWKTQKQIRLLLDTWFKDNIFGIPGDEDGGGMTAFVVFSSMGFYPVTPGSPIYTIGSPLFEKVVIELTGGKQFTVLANNCSIKNKYIQSAKLNGQVLSIPWFKHADIVAGGTLQLEMGPLPNKKWGLTDANTMFK